MSKAFVIRIFLLVVLFVMPLDMAARAEWESQPPEVMAGGEIIGQFYHLFSNVEPPHRVWVKYQDKIYFCRGEGARFQCEESNDGGASEASAAAPPAP